MFIQKDIGRSIAVTYDNTANPTVDTVLIYKKGVRVGFNGSWQQDAATSGTLALCLVTLAFNDVDELGDLVVVISSGGNGLGERELQVVDYNPDNGPSLAAPTLEAIANAVWSKEDTVEADFSAQEVMMALLAMASGESFKDGDGKWNFKNPDGSKNRVKFDSITPDGRTGITFDFS